MHISNFVFILMAIFSINSCKSAPVEEAVLEYGPGYNTYGHQQMKVAQMRGIKPVVDTIREEEKYGNDGGLIRTASNTFIKLTEGASASLTNTLGVPNDNTYNLVQPLFPILTDLGNRLGGLA